MGCDIEIIGHRKQQYFKPISIILRNFFHILLSFIISLILFLFLYVSFQFFFFFSRLFPDFFPNCFYYYLDISFFFFYFLFLNLSCFLFLIFTNFPL